MIWYNYRMQNIYATLLVVQLEQLDKFIRNKKKLNNENKKFFKDQDYTFFTDLKSCSQNYWIKLIILKSKVQKYKLLKKTNFRGILTRPIWKFMNKLLILKYLSLEN